MSSRISRCVLFAPENLSSQQRRRPSCASAQFNQHLCYPLSGKYSSQSSYMQNFDILARLYRWADQFKSHFVRNPGLFEAQFSLSNKTTVQFRNKKSVVKAYLLHCLINVFLLYSAYLFSKLTFSNFNLVSFYTVCPSKKVSDDQPRRVWLRRGFQNRYFFLFLIFGLIVILVYKIVNRLRTNL